MEKGGREMLGGPMDRKERASLTAFAAAVVFVLLAILTLIMGVALENEEGVGGTLTVVALVFAFSGVLLLLYALYERKVYILVPIFCFVATIAVGRVVFSKPNLIVSALISILGGVIPPMVKEIRS